MTDINPVWHLFCRVETPQKFLGAVHARDFRRAACTAYGLGGTTTDLNVNMLAEKNMDAYCGVFINEVSYYVVSN